MQIANLYITMELLSYQLDFLSPGHLTEVSNMALISALFYGPGFLKSNNLGRASYNDLTSISHYRQLWCFMPEASRIGLETWERHLDYLTPQNIVWSLVNDDFSDDQRERLAQALLTRLDARDISSPLPPNRVTYPGPNFTTSHVFWPNDSVLPNIANLITEESFLVFNILRISNADLRDWWEAPVVEWSDDRASPHYKLGYHSVKSNVVSFDVVNDAAER